jgi:transposase
MCALLAPAPLIIRLVRLSGTTMVLEAAATAAAAYCPDCGARSTQIHDRYQRHPADLPWRGYRVQLAVTVRRFRCRNPACARATFAEDFGPALPHYARHTADARTLLVQFAQRAGAEGGAQLAHKAGLPVSPDTLLRLLRQTAHASPCAPRVLSLDDLSLRRGRTYRSAHDLAKYGRLPAG